MIFCSFLEKKFVLKYRILGNTEFQKTGQYVTGRVGMRSLSRGEIACYCFYYFVRNALCARIKIDVQKYMQTIFMVLGAFLKEKLHNQRLWFDPCRVWRLWAYIPRSPLAARACRKIPRSKMGSLRVEGSGWGGRYN